MSGEIANAVSPFFFYAPFPPAPAASKRRRFVHILSTKQFNKYIGDKNASVSRVEARLFHMRSDS
jgi:hypothetical protein